MGDHEYRESIALERRGFLDYDLADAIYAACLVESLKKDSLFYFMDAEDGGTSMQARASFY